VPWRYIVVLTAMEVQITLGSAAGSSLYYDYQLQSPNFKNPLLWIWKHELQVHEFDARKKALGICHLSHRLLL
jgi:hypothetical protein